MLRLSRPSTFTLLCACALVVGLSLPMIVGAAPAKYPIRPGVKLKVSTTRGIRTVALGGLSKSQALAKLQRYSYKASPKTLRIYDRGTTYSLDLTSLKFKPTYGGMLEVASKATTDTVKSVPYVGKAVQLRIAAKINRWADKRYVKTKTVTLVGNTKIRHFGGYRIDRAVTTKLAIAQIAEYGRTTKKAVDTITARVNHVKPVVVNNSGKKLVVSKLQRRVYLISGNRVVVSYPIAIGMPGYSTPNGSFTIARKAKNPTWNNPGSAWAAGMASSLSGSSSPLGVRALYLYQGGRDTGIRFHGTSADYSIGTAASHGCMRMHNSDVKKLYEQVPVGTRVYIYN